MPVSGKGGKTEGWAEPGINSLLRYGGIMNRLRFRPDLNPAGRRACAQVLAVCCALVTTQALASDWPQWRGPDRSGVSAETGLLKRWPAGGPRLLWKAGNLGEGHATPCVAAGRIYGM